LLAGAAAMISGNSSSDAAIDFLGLLVCIGLASERTRLTSVQCQEQK
jgi:hypothetical protein